MSIQWHPLPTAQDAAEACARHIRMLLRELTAGGLPASLAISGGSTPKLMFDALAKAELPWELVHIFWVDERSVPPADPESNYRMAEEHLLRPAGIRRRNVHRIAGELRPADAARRYVDEIREFFGLAPGELPQFDIIHRGMGPDAHTASLFPGEPLLADRRQIAAAVYVKKFDRWRVTLLPGVLLAASHTLMLITGEDKAPALRAIFHEEYDPLQYPAQLGVHDGRGLVWFVDELAAKLMD
ncbi:MAG: 6-phosphogluconolactonase [Acidobacteria bacterium]|nr:6-phosphogluconolactonase [Acidobacteriota bacterium]